MYCPRLDHFVRFNADGSISPCGHMVNSQKFKTVEELHDSVWLQNIKFTMKIDRWPDECSRCRDSEASGAMSVRQFSLDRHQQLLPVKEDYIILGGVLDNVCNSACQSCNATLSTKIGSLDKKNYIKIDNFDLIDTIDVSRVVEIDLNGGEPTASPRYQRLLTRLPENTQIVRVNTNGSRVLPNIQQILDRKIKVLITLSLDGTGPVHDYVRWPIKWDDYCETVKQYQDLRSQYPNLELQAWTTLHALNVGDWENIAQFAQENSLAHSWAFLEYPIALDARFKNHLTKTAKFKISSLKQFVTVASGIDNQCQLDRFIEEQDSLRNISIKDFM